MPHISINQFRNLNSTNLDASVRLDGSGENVTSAKRGLAGRAVRVLVPSKQRQENLQVARELFGALKRTYGQEIANQAFKSIRGDASIGAGGNLVLNKKIPLTARDVKLAISTAEVEKNAAANKEKIASIAQDYVAGSELFERLAGEAGVDAPWPTAKQEFFNQRLTSTIKDLLEKETPEHPLYADIAPHIINKAVKQAISYVNGLSIDEIANKQLQFSDVADKGGLISKAVFSGKNIAESFGALISQTENLTKDAALGVDIELDNDALNDARNSLVRDAVESIPPRDALELLEAFNKPGTQARAFLLALGVNTGFASFHAKGLGALANAEVTTAAELFITQLGKRVSQPELAKSAWDVYLNGFNATASEEPLSKDGLSNLLKANKAGNAQSYAKQFSDVDAVREQRLISLEAGRIIKDTAASIVVKTVAGNSEITLKEIADKLHISEHTLRNHLASIYENKVKPFLPESGIAFSQFAEGQNVSISKWSGAKLALYRSRLAETVREDHESFSRPKTAQEEGLKKVAAKALRYVDQLSNEEAANHLQAWDGLKKTGLDLVNALADQADAKTITDLLTSFVNQRNALAPDVAFEAIDSQNGLGGEDRASLTNQAVDIVVDNLPPEDAASIASHTLKPDSIGRALIIASNLDLTRRSLTSQLDPRSSSLDSASRSTNALLFQITQRLADKGKVADARQQLKYLTNDLYIREEGDVTSQEFIDSAFKTQFFTKAQVSPELIGEALGIYEATLEGQLNTPS